MARKKKEEATEFYSLSKIMKIDAKYYMIFGQRSNGKTYAVLELILKNYVKSHKQGAILRRFTEDFRGKRGASMFNNHINNGLVTELTNDRYNSIKYQSKQWFLCHKNDDGEIDRIDEKPFCYAFSLSEMEHDKSSSYPRITTICFDEFLSRTGYLNDEFILFMNTLSTIIRTREDVKIFMLGNTVNKYCPYFAEMGLKHIKEMESGSIDTYRYSDKKLVVAVEYAEPSKATTKSNSYFAFDNPKLQMITTGAWELDIYPHSPARFTMNDVIRKIYIIWDNNIIEGDFVSLEDYDHFLFFHQKTTPLKEKEGDMIFSTEFTIKRGYFRNIKVIYNPISKMIMKLFKVDRVFYQDNEVGDMMYNYLKWCDKN